MRVDVAYAEAQRQVLLSVNLSDGATVKEAVEKSGILAKCPQIDLSTNKLGVYGKIVEPDQPLGEGDRVEIYRPALGKPPKKGAKGAEEGDAETSDKPSPAARAAAARKAAAPKAPADPPAAKEAGSQPASSGETAAAPAAPSGEGAGEGATPAAEDRAAKVAAAKARAAAAKARMAAKKEGAGEASS